MKIQPSSKIWRLMDGMGISDHAEFVSINNVTDPLLNQNPRNCSKATAVFTASGLIPPGIFEVVGFSPNIYIYI